MTISNETNLRPAVPGTWQISSRSKRHGGIKHAHAPHSLFLCTGNYYRSRFAEILFNHRASHLRLDWRAESRGLKIGWLGNIGAISPDAIATLEARGIRCATVERMPI